MRLYLTERGKHSDRRCMQITKLNIELQQSIRKKAVDPA